MVDTFIYGLMSFQKSILLRIFALDMEFSKKWILDMLYLNKICSLM